MSVPHEDQVTSTVTKATVTIPTVGKIVFPFLHLSAAWVPYQIVVELK